MPIAWCAFLGFVSDCDCYLFYRTEWNVKTTFECSALTLTAKGDLILSSDASSSVLT